MKDSKAILLAIAPRGSASIRAGFAETMSDCIVRAELNSPLRLAHFLAQCAHESDGFKTTHEYASGAAYEGRKDLGNTHPGDGKRYKGRGLIQETGRANYRIDGAALGLDLEEDPEQAAKFPAAALVAAQFWKRKNCNVFADADDVVGATRRVNGGHNGLESRKIYLARAKHAIGDVKGALFARATEERAAENGAKKLATGSVALAGGSQVGHTAPQAPWWSVAAFGLLLVMVAVAILQKARDSGESAKFLEQTAAGA